MSCQSIVCVYNNCFCGKSIGQAPAADMSMLVEVEQAVLLLILWTARDVGRRYWDPDVISCSLHQRIVKQDLTCFVLGRCFICILFKLTRLKTIMFLFQ